MTQMSSDVAKKFCELCDWVQECWLTHKRLFEENDRTGRTIGKAKYFTARLSIITQEYALLQICKMHDPAMQKNSLNLTIDYMNQFGDWGEDAEKFQKIVSRLSSLFEKLKSARNKVLAHNDFEAIMGSATLGDFPKGLDDQYFLALQELVNVIHMKWFNTLYPFNDLAGADVDEFLCVIEKGPTQFCNGSSRLQDT